MTLSNIPTVQSIRQNGGKVRVVHSRYVLDKEKNQLLLMPKHEIVEKFGNLKGVCPKGGQTEVNISWNGQEYSGRSVCAINETFNYKTGNTYAIAKAMGLTVPIEKIVYTLADIRRIGCQMGADMREAFKSRKTLPYKSLVIDLEGLTHSQRQKVLKSYLNAVANS